MILIMFTIHIYNSYQNDKLLAENSMHVYSIEDFFQRIDNYDGNISISLVLEKELTNDEIKDLINKLIDVRNLIIRHTSCVCKNNQSIYHFILEARK